MNLSALRLTIFRTIQRGLQVPLAMMFVAVYPPTVLAIIRPVAAAGVLAVRLSVASLWQDEG